MNEVERLRLELEKAQKQHLAIVRKFASGICSEHQEPDADCDICNVKLSLPGLIESHKAVWREQVKPLISALEKAENAIQRSAGINDETRLGWALKDVDAALTHARTLGL